MPRRKTNVFDRPQPCRGQTPNRFGSARPCQGEKPTFSTSHSRAEAKRQAVSGRHGHARAKNERFRPPTAVSEQNDDAAELKRGRFGLFAGFCLPPRNPLDNPAKKRDKPAAKIERSGL
jgi:hypothetical protein